MDEDKTADVFVKSEDCPHGDESPSQRDTEEVASDHLYAPHHDYSEDYREIDVAGASETVEADDGNKENR